MWSGTLRRGLTVPRLSGSLPFTCSEPWISAALQCNSYQVCSWFMGQMKWKETILRTRFMIHGSMAPRKSIDWSRLYTCRSPFCWSPLSCRIFLVLPRGNYGEYLIRWLQSDSEFRCGKYEIPDQSALGPERRQGEEGNSGGGDDARSSIAGTPVAVDAKGSSQSRQGGRR
jgi:hypothetical protein